MFVELTLRVGKGFLLNNFFDASMARKDYCGAVFLKIKFYSLYS